MEPRSSGRYLPAAVYVLVAALMARGPLAIQPAHAMTIWRLAIAIATLIIFFSTQKQPRGRLGWGGWLLVIYALYLVLGSAVAIWSGSGTGTLRMAVGLLPGLVAIRGSLTAEQASRVVTAVAVGGTLYAAVHLLGRQSAEFRMVGLTQPYSHEAAFLLVATLVACVMQRRAWLLLVNAALDLGIFMDYPAATYVVATATAGVVLAWMLLRRLRWLLVTLGAAVVGLYLGVLPRSVFNFDAFANAYLGSIDKASSLQTRQSLWDGAWVHLQGRELFGEAGAWVGTVRAFWITTRTVYLPPHNDVLTLLLSGGIVAVALYAAGSALLLWRILGSRPERGNPHHQLRVVGAAGFTVFLTSSLFNPLVTQPDLSALAFTMLGLGVAAAAAGRRVVSEPSTVAAPTS